MISYLKKLLGGKKPKRKLSDWQKTRLRLQALDDQMKAEIRESPVNRKLPADYFDDSKEMELPKGLWYNSNVTSDYKDLNAFGSFDD